MNKFVFFTLFLCISIQMETVNSVVSPTAKKLSLIDMTPRQAQAQCPGTMCQANCPGHCCLHPPGMEIECCQGCSFCAPKGGCGGGPGRK